LQQHEEPYAPRLRLDSRRRQRHHQHQQRSLCQHSHLHFRLCDDLQTLIRRRGVSTPTRARSPSSVARVTSTQTTRGGQRRCGRSSQVGHCFAHYHRRARACRPVAEVSHVFQLNSLDRPVYVLQREDPRESAPLHLQHERCDRVVTMLNGRKSTVHECEWM
jgi:hypothetical protein